MINLLPDSEKEELLKIRKSKIILIFEVGFFLFFLTLAAATTGFNIFLDRSIQLQQELILQEKSGSTLLDAKSLWKKAEEANRNIAEIVLLFASEKKTGLSLSEKLELIFNLLPREGYLTGVSLQDDRLTVFGFMPSRQLLLSLKEAIQKDSRFSKVNFPSTNWTKAENIDFSFTLTLKGEK